MISFHLWARDTGYRNPWSKDQRGNGLTCSDHTLEIGVGSRCGACNPNCIYVFNFWPHSNDALGDYGVTGAAII